MSIIARFKDIMSSNINAMLDKAENPEKMIDQYLRNAKADLAVVRKETAGVMSEEKRAKGKVDELNAGLIKLTELAKKALHAGNRGDAEVFISKKQEMELELPTYVEIYEASVINSSQMKEMHNKLVADIGIMENRKGILKGKLAATKARETVNKMGASSNKYGATMGKMGEMEDKVNARFNIAMSESELLNEPEDEATLLANKYKGAGSATVGSELDELEIELGLKTRLDEEV